MEDAEGDRFHMLRFLKEHGLDNDLFIQCGTTQQSLRLSPRQIFEVLSSSAHVCTTQQLLARAQTPVQETSSGTFHEMRAAHEIREGLYEDPAAGGLQAVPGHPVCRPSIQTLGNFHNPRVLELDPAALHAASSFGRAAPTQSTSQQWQELQQHGAGLAPAGHRRGTKRGHPDHQPTLTEDEKEKLRAAPEDGYRWRKYGEKTLFSKAGDISIKSYFRCCHGTCAMRKQVENGLSSTHVRLVGDGHNHTALGAAWNEFVPNSVEAQDPS